MKMVFFNGRFCALWLTKYRNERKFLFQRRCRVSPSKKKNESEISIKKKKFQTVFICSKLQYIYWNCPPPTSRNVRVPNHVRSRRNVSACQVTVGYLRNHGIVESDSGYCSINFSRKCLFASLNDFLF